MGKVAMTPLHFQALRSDGLRSPKRGFHFQKITLWNPVSNICGFRVTGKLSSVKERLNCNKSILFDVEKLASSKGRLHTMQF